MENKNMDIIKWAKEELKKMAHEDDIESAHYEADSILCKLLEELGYEEIVKLFKAVPKWYC